MKKYLLVLICALYMEWCKSLMKLLDNSGLSDCNGVDEKTSNIGNTQQYYSPSRVTIVGNFPNGWSGTWFDHNGIDNGKIESKAELTNIDLSKVSSQHNSNVYGGL